MPRYTVDKVPDRDWVTHVQSSWKPIVISGFVLKFPWHGPSVVLEALNLSQCAIKTGDVTNDGGSKFTELELEGEDIYIFIFSMYANIN
jgi:hypothetical protein